MDNFGNRIIRVEFLVGAGYCFGNYCISDFVMVSLVAFVWVLGSIKLTILTSK